MVGITTIFPAVASMEEGANCHMNLNIHQLPFPWKKHTEIQVSKNFREEWGKKIILERKYSNWVRPLSLDKWGRIN